MDRTGVTGPGVLIREEIIGETESSCLVNSGIFIKQEVNDETEPSVSTTDSKEEGKPEINYDVSSSGLSVLEEMTDQTKSTCDHLYVKPEKIFIPDEVFSVVIKEEERPNIDYAGELVYVKEENELLVPDEDIKWNISIKEEMTTGTESTSGGITHVKQEEELIVPDEDLSPGPSMPQSDDSSQDLDFKVDEQELESNEISSDEDVLNKRNTILESKEGASSFGLSVPEDMANQTKSTCELVYVKQERELLVPDEVATISIKEEEGRDIYYGDHVYVKQEEIFIPEEAGDLVHVKQERELLVPDEVATISIKEEDGQDIYNDINNWDVSIKEEIEMEIESSCGVTHVKQETYLKQEEELLVPDEDSSRGPSMPRSGDSSRDLNFMVDEQDLDSIEISSGEDVLSKSNKIVKSKKGAKDSCHEKGKPHQCCPHCDYKSVTHGNMKNHIMARHTSEKLHQCPHCYYKTVRPDEMKKHIMTHHTGEKPHQCPHCDYKTVRSGVMKNHIMARHTGEKPHQCPHCDYKSVRSGDMKIHIMIRHTGEKPHHCPHCDYKSVRSGDMKKHIMTHSYVFSVGEKTLQCPHCDYKSVHTLHMINHVISHRTGEKPQQ
ncbi:zinc finger autosomal protein isoform X3 [Halyomorpha halys]|uniref:zinc finger autosomal protein isoform X3 n=1 Tax=Halyomorpha halys TaxID=286706 RepID=UPI0034D2BE35